MLLSVPKKECLRRFTSRRFERELEELFGKIPVCQRRMEIPRMARKLDLLESQAVMSRNSVLAIMNQRDVESPSRVMKKPAGQ
jgi:hypothetical protein